MSSVHLGIIDDFCVNFLLEKQKFPAKISKLFDGEENFLVEYFSHVQLEDQLQTFLRLANTNKTLQREGIGKFLERIKSGRTLVDDLISSESFIHLFSCYLDLYSLNCPFDVATTTKYNSKKRECCVVSRMNIPARTLITGLCGVFCPLDSNRLQNIAMNGNDFSIMYSKATSKEGIFIGPARFVNHCCEPNCEVRSTLG